MTEHYAPFDVSSSRLDNGAASSNGRAAAIDRTPPSRNPGRMRTADLITKKLTEAFAPQSLKVEDESHRHEGHAGHRPGGQTHFRVYIVSQAFKGKTRIERHRMINEILSDELAGGVHALAIHAAAPGEGAARSTVTRGLVALPVSWRRHAILSDAGDPAMRWRAAGAGSTPPSPWLCAAAAGCAAR